MNEVEKIKPKPLEFSLDGENYMLGAEVGYVLGQGVEISDFWNDWKFLNLQKA